MALINGTRLGPYEVTAQIGAGGMGEVFRARDSKLNRDVAIKVLLPAVTNDPDRLARFSREAQVLASLNHPNIAAIYGLEDAGDVRALVMELVEGPTIADRIARGPIPLDEALPIAKQIAEALEAAHEQGIIHRDLKPANIKVRPDGTVKVLDFGLAKAMDPAGGSSANAMNSPTLSMHATQAGIILGTAAYMSPEQAKGKPVDARADIWAFGAVLYEMLTGTRAFAGEDISDTMVAVLSKDPAWVRLPTDAPLRVRELLRRCLERDVRRRLQAIGEARIQLDDLLSGTREEARLVGPAPRRSLWWRLILPAIASTAAAVGLAALVAIALHGSPVAPASQFVKLSLQAPDSMYFDTTAVSPDGRSVALSAADGSGQTKLWIQSLDGLSTRSIQGSEGAWYPFWSPDSRQLAFSARGRLQKIAIAGGPPQTILNEEATRGASWTKNGMIAYEPSNGRSGLMQVTADGGTPAPLTQLDASKGESSHRWVSFLPDGRHFLFTVRSTHKDVPGIYLGSVGSSEHTRLLPDLSNASYVRTPSGAGYVLFARGRSLLAQALDVDRRRLVDEPILVAENVWFNRSRSYASFSASDTGVLAFDTVSRGRQAALVSLDRAGTREATFGQYSPTKITTSPDGRKLVLDSLEPETGTFTLWMIDIERSVSSRLTPVTDRDETSPVWSPDGSRVAFASGPSLFERNASGGGEDVLLLKSERAPLLNDWSADDRFLVYQQSDGTNSRLWLLPMSTGTDRRPVAFTRPGSNAHNGAFSPDGSFLAYESDESGRWEIYVEALGPNGAGGGRWRVSKDGGQYAQWRRDGRELFYFDERLSSIVVSPTRLGPQFSVGPPQTLFRGLLNAGITATFAMAADGQHFFIAPPIPPNTVAPLTVVLNWTAVLKK